MLSLNVYKRGNMEDKSNSNEKQKFNPHEKHRERMRNKVEKNGLLSLPPHEVLEFLLMYAIPRVDTNPIAHELINTFGSIDKVVDADLKDLKMVKGVGPNAALYLKSLADFVKCYETSKNKSVKYYLTTTAKCIEYFRSNHAIENVENLYVVCLNNKYNIIKIQKLNGEDASMVMTDTRDFAGLISNKKVHAVVIFHTHPGGSVVPTAEDFKATRQISQICSAIGVKFLDHIIFNETEHYSFKQYNAKYLSKR